MNPDPNWILHLQSLGWDAAVKIAVAALLGAIVGLEREWGGHEAGLRTNMLIAISSCLFTILSIEGFPLQGSAQDTARVAAQIVTGVGFLGAGVVLQARGHVRGLTTAASIWLVAAIGMAVGTGTYFLAAFATILSMVSLMLLAPVSHRLEQRAEVRRMKDQGSQKRAAEGEDREASEARFLD
jgi:putative Mg2+ transporter-C (MgtC) family protein